MLASDTVTVTARNAGSLAMVRDAAAMVRDAAAMVRDV